MSSAIGQLPESLLKANEVVVRRDLCLFRHTATLGFWPNTEAFPDALLSGPLAALFVTDARIIVLPPRVPWWYDFTLLLPLLTLSTIRRFPAHRGVAAFGLGEIDRFWKWQPEFSGPPMFQIGPEAWTFQLMCDKSPWNKVASVEAEREHFDAITAAWDAARRTAQITADE